MIAATPAAGAGVGSPVISPRAPWLWPLCIFLLALGLRAAAARGDFWLDEIWSWVAVRDRVHSIGDVFFNIRHEANHITNSLWIHALGLEVDWHWYRLPAVLAGSLSVLLARRLLAPAGRAAQEMVTLLYVPSFLLINYASEARGYGVLMLCALANLWAIEGYERARLAGRRRAAWGAAGGVWMAAALGTLAHASYGATLVALAMWYAVHVLRKSRDGRASLGHFAVLFALPFAFAAWLWVVNFLQVTVGGGPLMSAWQAAAALASLALGGPMEGAVVWPLAIAAMLALALESALLWRAGDDRALLWMAMLLAPAVPLAAGVHSQLIYPRFFLGVALFGLLALANLAARGWQRGGAVRLMVCGALALITLGNLVSVARLVRDGRGQPGAAVRWMATHSHGPRIVVATDDAFRHGVTLDYYKRLLKPGQSLQLLLEPPWPAQGPEWILRQDISPDWQPAPALHDAEGRAYQLEALYPHAGLSGFTLAVYHRRDAQASTSSP